jgi:hypothetical protein
MKAAQKKYKTFEEIHREFQALSKEEHMDRARALVKAWRKLHGRK